MKLVDPISGMSKVEWIKMSNMEDLEKQLSEHSRQRQVFSNAVGSLEQAKRRKLARGYAVVASVMSLSSGADRVGSFDRAAHGAKLFLILFAFLAPSLLVWKVLL